MSGIPTITIISITCSLLACWQLSSAETPAQETQGNLPGKHAEKTFTLEFELDQPTDYCKSRTTIGYRQKNGVANVTGEITVDNCTNAAGEYTISVRIRDANGNIQNLDFEESWERSDVAPHVFSKDYAIGANVDLINVRARRPRCVCNDIETAPEDDSED